MKHCTPSTCARKATVQTLPMPETHTEQQPKRTAPLPKHPTGLRKSLLPRPVKRFDSADYFLQQHLEKQRMQQQPMQPTTPVDPVLEVAGYSQSSSRDVSRPTSSESERTDNDDVGTTPPALSRPAQQYCSSDTSK